MKNCQKREFYSYIYNLLRLGKHLNRCFQGTNISILYSTAWILETFIYMMINKRKVGYAAKKQKFLHISRVHGSRIKKLKQLLSVRERTYLFLSILLL